MDKKRVLSFTLFLLLGSGHFSFPVEAQTPSIPKTENRPLRVLFIGNSYTWFNNLPHLVEALAVSGHENRPLAASMVVEPAYTLKQHWEKGTALSAILHGGPWDYVVLQEQSDLGGGLWQHRNSYQPTAGFEMFYQYSSIFDSAIKQSKAHTVFFLTWAKHNHPETQSALNEAYFGIGKRLGAQIAPVGMAWHHVLESNPALQLHQSDESHPTPTGSYLAACVIYATLYGHSAEGLVAKIKADPAGIPQASMTMGAQLGDVDLDAKTTLLLQCITTKTIIEAASHAH